MECKPPAEWELLYFTDAWWGEGCCDSPDSYRSTISKNMVLEAIRGHKKIWIPSKESQFQSKIYATYLLLTLLYKVRYDTDILIYTSKL
jgi:hypothetical protein